MCLGQNGEPMGFSSQANSLPIPFCLCRAGRRVEGALHPSPIATATRIVFGASGASCQAASICTLLCTPLLCPGGVPKANPHHLHSPSACSPRGRALFIPGLSGDHLPYCKLIAHSTCSFLPRGRSEGRSFLALLFRHGIPRSERPSESSVCLIRMVAYGLGGGVACALEHFVRHFSTSCRAGPVLAVRIDLC